MSLTKKKKRKIEHVPFRPEVCLGYLAAFFLPLAAGVIICAMQGVYPFGERCILHVDMYHQYCPFFTELLNKLQNGGSLMYSWNVGLGSDFYSLWVYYLSSPLNWLLIFCPRAYVIEFMTITILVKIGFAGTFMYHFLRRSFGREEKAAVIFAVAYAFSGFVAAYSWDIMWMDCVALAPLVMWGLKKMIALEKPGLYYLSLSLAILANYYLAIMICIFLVFYFVLLFFENGENMGKRMRGLGRFTLYSLLAGGTGVVMLLPEMIVLNYSGSSGISFPDTFEWYFNILAEMGRMCAGAESYTGNDHWPNLYAGAFVLLLVCVYLLNKAIPLKKKFPRLLMVVFFLLSFSNNWLDFIWHGLHFPDSLPGRESFLFIFLMIAIAYDCYIHPEGTDILRITIGGVVAGGLLLAGLIFGDSEITDQMTVVITVLLVLFYSILLIWEKVEEENGKKLLRAAFWIVAAAELFVNMEMTGFYTVNRTDYFSRMSDYEELLSQAREQAGEDAFYRVEDTERNTKNDDCLYGYASGTQFSSLMNINVSHFYQSLYMEGGKNFYCYNGATPLTSAMLSVRYSIYDSPNEESDLRELVGESNGYYLYRNIYCLAPGYCIPEESAAAWEASDADDIYGINTLAYLLGASGDLLEGAEVEQNNESGSTTLTMEASGYYYACYDSCNSDSLTFTFDRGTTTGYSKTTHEYLFDLGRFEAGQSVTITNSNSESIHFQVYRLNQTALNEAYLTLAKNQLDVTEWSDTRIKGTISNSEDGRLIIPVADEPGWTLYVDGVQTEITAFDETFISTELSAGKHVIELDYQTPGLVEGACVSGACLVIFLILMILRKRTA